MATRFYFQANTGPALPTAVPTPHANWNTTTGGQTEAAGSYWRGRLVAEPFSYSPVSGNSLEAWQVGATQPQNVLNAQYISDPLPVAGTTGGTFSAVVQMFLGGFASAYDCYLQIIIRVVSGDGLTIRGTAYAGQVTASTVTTSGANNQKPTTAGLTRRVSALALSGVAYQAGDRLVVEIGRRSFSAVGGANTSSVTIQEYWMDSDWDHPLLADLPMSQTRNTWIEFSQDLFGTLTAEQYRMSGGTTLNASPALPFVDVTKITGLDSADVAYSGHSREGAHGGYVDSEFETQRTVVIEGNIYASNTALENYLDTLKNQYAPSRRDRQFYFATDNGQRMIWGKSQGLRYDKESGRRLGIIPFQVTIICEDPRIYTPGLLTQTLTMVSSTLVTLDFALVGNRDTPVRFLLIGPMASNITLRAYSTGGNSSYFYTGTALTAGENIEIDSDRRSIFKSTTNVRKDFPGAFWRNLYPGNVRLTASCPASTTGSIVVQYQEAWR